MKEYRTALEILTSKPTGKRLLGRPRCEWEDNVRILKIRVIDDSAEGIDY